MHPPLTPDEVKTQLRARYGTLGKFERAKGLPYRSVSMLLIGKAILPTAEAVAEELDVPVYRVSSHYHRQFYNLSTAPHRRERRSAHHLNVEALR